MISLRQLFKSLATALTHTMLSVRDVVAIGERDSSFLDLAEAKRFVENNPNGIESDISCSIPIDLSAYTQATPEALEYIAAQGYNSFVDLGLSTLNNKQAQILAKWDAAFSFTNLGQLDTEVADILSEGDGRRHFEKPMAVTPEIARRLAKFRGPLALKMDSISLEVANELANHSHELYLKIKVPPSVQILAALCRHVGYYVSVTEWECQPDNELQNFKSPNGVKDVSIEQFKNKAGNWIQSATIQESLCQWERKRSNS